jgi:general secretion pathway protein M
MNLPVGPRGRIVALLLVLLPVLVVLRFVISPLFGAYGEFSNEIESMQDEITRYRTVIGERPALQTAAAELQKHQPLTPFLLPGGNPALAAAALQRHLQKLAAEHKARIVSVRVQPAIPDGPLQKISVQARLQADSRSLRDLLHALESGTPFVFIDTLNISTRQARRRRSAIDRLEVNMNLSALRAPDEQGSGERKNG